MREEAGLPGKHNQTGQQHPSPGEFREFKCHQSRQLSSAPCPAVFTTRRRGPETVQGLRAEVCQESVSEGRRLSLGHIWKSVMLEMPGPRVSASWSGNEARGALMGRWGQDWVQGRR